MRNEKYDVTVIGGGPAGMSAAIGLQQAGLRVALLEREPTLGGILMQCIHNGFGLQHFKEDLTGPEYAERLMAEVTQHPEIDLYTDTTVTDVNADRHVVAMSPKLGVLDIENDAIVLAMGCRERNVSDFGGCIPNGITRGFERHAANRVAFIGRLGGITHGDPDSLQRHVYLLSPDDGDGCSDILSQFDLAG